MRDIHNLVEEIIKGRKREQEEQAAFSELVAMFQDMAYGLAFSILGIVIQHKTLPKSHSLQPGRKSYN